MFVWRKSFYPSYFPFNIVKVSVKIRDLRAHFALTGQTHSRAALARWVIWYPTLIPVSARFCSAMINVTKSHIQHREAQQSGQEIGQWEACFFVKLPIRGQLFPCHTWPVEVVMTWSCDERFMTCIHDTISWVCLIGQNTAFLASYWLINCIILILQITRESEESTDTVSRIPPSDIPSCLRPWASDNSVASLCFA